MDVPIWLFTSKKPTKKQCIKTAKRIISLEIQQSILTCHDILRIRTYSTSSCEKTKIKILSNIDEITDLCKLFSALQRYVNNPFHRDDSDSNEPEGNKRENSDEYHEYFEIRRQVKVRWSKEEIRDTG